MLRRSPVVLLLLVVSFVSCAGEAALPEMPALGETVALPDDPDRQFDFWLGEWNVQNKHLRGGWKDSGRSVARIQPVAGGNVVLEQWNGELGGDPLIGFSLRAYDPELEKWVIWLNWHGGAPGGFNAMHGLRNGERIELFNPGTTTGTRYTFSQAHQDSCQWDQSNSDDGKDWTTTWIMQFTRREPLLPVDASNAPIVLPPQSASGFAKTRALDHLIGAWNGTARRRAVDGSWEEGTARTRITSMIEGFGLLQFLDTGWGEKTINALGWDSGVDGWVALHASSDSHGILHMKGKPGEGGDVTFLAPEAGLRQGWSCGGPDHCTWRRESSTDGGTTWKAVLEVELTRSASEAAWIEIPKAKAPFAQVLTGGQPSADDLTWAARNGYRTVVNLRSPGEEGELADEAALVARLGMTYRPIPIAGADDLTNDSAQLLAEALSGDDALPAIVHCKSGNRVGALFAIKAHAVDGRPIDDAIVVGLDSGMTRLEPMIREKLASKD